MANKKVRIATVGSHSALQILKGAKDEGFETIVLTAKKQSKLYKRFPLADQHFEMESYSQFPSFDGKLVEQNAILVPHGSIVSYASLDKLNSMKSMYFGNKKILGWESDRAKQREWLSKAGLKLPRQFKHPSEIDSHTIVKYYGAAGGKGYFVVKNEKEYEAGMSKFGRQPAVMQEYIVGVPFYVHYFQSPLTGELEIMSMDRRYETNVDSLGRLPLKSQQSMEINPSFVVVGNAPLVLRESMLEPAFEMGEKLVEASREFAGPRGLFGPFCIETIITPEQEFYVVEVSARIVAGTNLFVEGSPYTALKYGKPVSTGRRIAMEVRHALDQDRLGEIID